VVGVMQRGRALLAQEAAALADASRGRFALGIGASSDRIIEGWNGMPFEKPLSKMSETIDFLRTALAGERADGGFKLERAPEEKVPIIVAALRGKMLRLAVEKGDGAFTNFLPLAGLPKVVVSKDPSCGCCSGWVDHLKAAGFPVEVRETVTRELLRNLFDGDVTAFVTQLLDSRKLTREEVADLQRLVRNKARR